MAERSTALPRGMYRDPAEVVVFAESKTCAGCVFVMVAFNSAYCDKGKQYGKRCKYYRETECG